MTSENEQTRQPEPNGVTEQESLSVQLWAIASSLKLAVWLMGIIALLVALGTLIIQLQKPLFYETYYGETIGGSLLALGFDDLFHSPLFKFLLGLFALNMTMAMVRYILKGRLSLYWLGFYCAHLSVPIILIASSWGYNHGREGIVRLSQNGSFPADRFFDADRREEVQLGFQLKLLELELARKPAVHRLIVQRERAHQVASAPMHPGRPVTLSRLPFEIDMGRFSETADGEPTAELSIKFQGFGRAMRKIVPVDTAMEIAGGYSVRWSEGDRMLQVIRHFETVSEAAVNPDRRTPVQHVDFSLYCLSLATDERGVATGGRFRITDNKTGDSVEKNLSTGGHRPLRWGAFQLELRSYQPVHAYRSRVAVIENGREVERHLVEVNSPLHWKGFSFYQHQFDEEQGLTVFQVIHDTSRPYVFAGFILMLLGVSFVYYARPYLRRRKKRAAA